MKDSFDRRVIAQPFLELVARCQRLAPCHLGGGAALSGAFLAHRMTGDVDLFCHVPDAFVTLRHELPVVAAEAGMDLRAIRESPTFVRFLATAGTTAMEIDLVDDRVPDVEPDGHTVEGIVVESLRDLRANKLTCLLSRSEPRDLVDLLFLDRAGFPPEADLPLALQKDAGVDPAILVWLLKDFPFRPLPRMLEPLDEDELRAFRDDLRERFRRLAVPE